MCASPDCILNVYDFSGGECYYLTSICWDSDADSQLSGLKKSLDIF